MVGSVHVCVGSVHGKRFIVRSLREWPTQLFDNPPKHPSQLYTVTNIRRTATESCFQIVQKSCWKLLQKRNRKQHLKINNYRMFQTAALITPPRSRKWNSGSVFGCQTGGLYLPFHGISECLHGLVSVYKHPVITRVRALIVYIW